MIETTKDEYEVFRNRNIKDRRSYLALSDDEDSEAEEFKRSLQELQDYKNILPASRPRGEKRKRGNGDYTFRFTGFIPKERRKSYRIAKLPPSYTGDELINDEYDENSKSSYNSDSVDDLERIVFRPKKIRRVLPQNQTVFFLPVEEVTTEMIAKIAKSSTKKTYSAEGTCCHQCRQKTTDTKTVCRSGRCVGINGQICGPCLKNRYGEDVATALMNPNWECPFCRGVCNCSFCRAHQGKRPTGILAPMALQQGFESVKHFLENLNGYGDFKNEKDDKENKPTAYNDELLLGFTENEIFNGCGDFMNKKEGKKREPKTFEGEPFAGFTQNEIDAKSCMCNDGGAH